MKYLKVYENFFDGGIDDNNIECGYYGLSRIFGITFDEVKDLFSDILDEHPFLDLEIKTYINEMIGTDRESKEFSVFIHDNRPYPTGEDFHTRIKNVSDVEISDSFIQELIGRLSEYNLCIQINDDQYYDRLSESIWFTIELDN